MKRNLLRVLLVTALLLVIAASRISRLNTREMDVDEVWSIWQTLGTPAQIINWTPYDWTPASYLILGAWRMLVGLHPVVVELLSVYAYLIGVALFYRVARRLYGETAAIIGMLAFAALGYSIYLSIVVRGYIFALALLPLALWLALDYFERPRVWRGVALAVCLAAMFYIHLTNVFAIAMIGLFVTCLYPRKILRWLLPASLTAIFAIPGFLSRQGLAYSSSRICSVATVPVGPLPAALRHLFEDYTGYAAAVWAILLGAASIIVVCTWYRQRCVPGRGLGLEIWVLTPVGLYFLYPLTGTFIAKHYAWVMVGLALWIGYGASSLLTLIPRDPVRLRRALVGVYGLAAILALVLMFLPIPKRYAIGGAPLVANFDFLAKNIQAGDVVLIDPNCYTATTEEWDYFTRAYFPGGLPYVQNPTGYRRVWYVTKEGSRDPAIDAAVQQGRIARQFVGPWDFLFRLYEGPPDATGILFDNGLQFHGLEGLEGDSVLTGPLARREGETIHLRLWWSVDQPVKGDYSISTQVLLGKDKSLTGQFDGPPQITGDPRETSRWTPGD